MERVLISNDGWQAEGFPIRQPRTGWYSHIANSTFSMKVETTVDTNFMLLLSMKSYGANFIGSKIAVTTRVVVKGSTVGNSTNATTTDGIDVPALGNTTGVGVDDVDRNSGFVIDGYHETKTSVHFPHKIPISDGGAKAGDTIILDVKLIGGSYFKIAGLAFCTF